MISNVKLIELNKRLLKSILKDSTIKTEEWSKYNTVDVIEEMNKNGIKKAWIGFVDIESGHVSPDLVDKATDLGYLVAPYDSYHSIHKSGEEKWSTAKFEDKSLYEDATVEDKSGKKLTGFQSEGRKLNPTLSLPGVKSRVIKILNDGKKAIKEEMADFKFLSSDKLVQMSKFGENLKVVANFSDKEYKYDNDTIKSNSLIIYDKNKKTGYSPHDIKNN